jgi:cytochrome b561
MPSQPFGSIKILDFRYDSQTVVLHWVTAFLVIFLWGSSQIIDFFPPGTPRIGMRSAHITPGVLLASVLIYRMTWRLSKGARPEVEETGWIAMGSKFVHFALYVLLATEVLLGLGNVWVRGDSIYGLLSIPAFPNHSRAMHNQMADLHRWIGHSLLILAGLHSVAALAHHFVLRDSVLARMWLRGKIP